MPVENISLICAPFAPEPPVAAGMSPCETRPRLVLVRGGREDEACDDDVFDLRWAGAAAC